ncbi:hypothetical protein M9458_001533 [Cirrhinus mrigala]|uniref:non-specific serine/threonine protein kinase n=1 Tax=Cirrhinus mrigala TaxID=683832 RepID=A0ABD0RZI1_CIRMR
MFEKECVHEPCVFLKTTTGTVEYHHHYQPDEAPVIAGGTDGGKEVEREEKKKRKSFWRWPALRFPRKAAKYDLAKAEKKMIFPLLGHESSLMANKSSRSPQIIKLLDWEDNKDHFIMVMERPMPSTDLKSFVKLHGERLDEGTARKFMRQVIEAANVCIKHGVFHRDIKMENLLVNTKIMEVKLIDFGCGAQMKKFAYEVFSEAYCPPEFTADGRYHAKLTTVWSLGILLFMMACGYYPTDYDLDLINKKS